MITQRQRKFTMKTVSEAKMLDSCHKLARLYQFWATHGTTLKGSPTLSREGDAPVALDKLPTSVDGGIRALGTPEERSAALYARACALGNGAACNVGGRMAVKGYGRDVNVADALQMFEHGCEECSDAHSCFALGTTHLRGERYGITADSAKAHPWLDKACLRGHANACQIVAVQHKKGDGVPVDMAKFEIYKQMTQDLVQKMGEQMGATIV